ncbi:hypothetical protein SAMN06269185_1250 [Natronoarchaeum philippinense]|uniref:DUF2240 family protein n=1 Tax=Natronoarchaeum philippinense TaxID=558529 RepID=A0A285NFK9_NATPI|nr:DUF2240 family protein [Natronoarchaeum philippinense]SNZ06676.1 hypothetical protein SAMN06269185_1250 [Natronoarchaeum philippinense]
MSLEVAVAAPFRQRGVDRMAENEFVVALSLDRDWFSPDQAKRLIDVATGRGLLERDGDHLVVGVEPDEVTIPENFVPDEEIIQERSPFEQALAALVDDGMQKQDAVAGINSLQSDLGVTIETAAVVFARRNGVDVPQIATQARDALAGEE